MCYLFIVRIIRKGKDEFALVEFVRDGAGFVGAFDGDGFCEDGMAVNGGIAVRERHGSRGDVKRAVVVQNPLRQGG